MEHPFITGGGTTIRAYDWGQYKAVLVQEPKSFGPIKYRYVMIVLPSGGGDPVLFVTSEQSSMQSELFKMARETTGDPSLREDRDSFFLGVFSKAGRRNLGASRKWGDLTLFEEAAARIAVAELGLGSTSDASKVQAAPLRNRQQSREPSSTSTRVLYGSLRTMFLALSWFFGGIAILFMVYVLIKNPREFFGNFMNPLWVVYFIPAIVCYWGADWARKKQLRR